MYTTRSSTYIANGKAATAPKVSKKLIKRSNTINNLKNSLSPRNNQKIEKINSSSVQESDDDTTNTRKSRSSTKYPVSSNNSNSSNSRVENVKRTFMRVKRQVRVGSKSHKCETGSSKPNPKIENVPKYKSMVALTDNIITSEVQ